MTCARCNAPCVVKGYTDEVFPSHDAYTMTREMGFHWCSHKCWRTHMDSLGAGEMFTVEG